MKKLLLIAFLSLGFISMQAENSFTTEQSVELGRGRYYHGRHNRGNINICDLPSNITKYLNKHYGKYDVMVAKGKGNGYYYLKISCDGNSYRPYYRSLVFDEKGRIVKG